MHCPAHTRRRSRHGFTLIEMVVVLLVLGISFALVAPALLPPQDRADAGVQRVIEAARRVAISRAAPVTVLVDADGRWVLLDDGSSRGTRLDEGVLRPPHGAAMRLRITPVGACIPGAQTDPGVVVDPVRCRLLTP